eukprot:gene27027-2254_t
MRASVKAVADRSPLTRATSHTRATGQNTLLACSWQGVQQLAPTLVAFKPRALVRAHAVGGDLASVKATVMKVTSNTKRGKATSAEQRSDILTKIESLEALNKEEAPAQSPLISGMWALLYQAPLDEEFSQKDKSGTTEGPFLAFFQPVTKDLVRTKSNLQLIDLPNNRVENLAEFVVAGRWEGSLNILGTVKVSEEEPAERVDVEFTNFVLRVGSSFQWNVPLTWVKPKGWIQTTFLDEEMRVGRGDKKWPTFELCSGSLPNSSPATASIELSGQGARKLTACTGVRELFVSCLKCQVTK